MTEPQPLPQPAIFNFDAYKPSEVEDAIEKSGVAKAKLAFLPCFVLGIVAGGGIGLGALYFTIVASDTTLNFALVRVIGGLAFSLGLTIVIVGGAELFTGDNLIVMAWASRRISTAALLRNWVIVWLGNFVGGVGVAILCLLSHHLDMNHGAIALAALTIAVGKISPGFVTLFFKGVLCNLLVCLAVWLAAAGRSVTDKIMALILPISAFVAAGFEHSVANMYFLSLAWLLKATGHVPAGFDASIITIPGVFYNLFWVTLGNIVGGAGLVGFTYWLVYHKGLAVPQPRQ